jgi:hypothetical protein
MKGEIERAEIPTPLAPALPWHAVAKNRKVD